MRWSSFSLESPSGNQSCYGNFEKESGTANEGIYKGSVVIPRYSESGEWKLQVWGSDETGNSIEYGWDLFYSSNSNGENTKTWVYTPFPASDTQSTLNVSSLQDFIANQYSPWPVALTVNKTSVDVSAADQKVKVQLTINNDDLPTSYSINVDFNLMDQNGYVDQNGYGSGNSISPADFKLVSGTVANGVYEGELIVPRYAKNGNYTISSIYINENNQSGINKSYSRWVDSIPTELRKTITVTGTQDVTAPVLQSILVSPTSADTRNGTILVTANLTITDDLSGLQEAEYSRGGALALRSPSGKEFLWSEFTSDDRISGNSTNGTYQVQFELPQYSEEGAWTIDYIELIDRNYNTRFLIPANLTAQQIAASTIQVQGWPRGWEQQRFASATATKGNATIQLSNLSLTYNGTEKVPTVATSPGNLTENVTLTYNGTTTPPIDPGTYTVVAFMDHSAYQGRQVATMTISKSSQTIGAFSAISDKLLGTAPFAVAAPTSSSDLPMILSVKSGPATLSGNTLTLTGAGTVVLVANQSGNENYNTAPEVTTSFNVTAPPPPAPAPQAPAAPAPSKKGKKPAAKPKAAAAAKKPVASKSNAGSTAKKSGGKKSKKK
jgi:hypothetical protein